ncbi:siroheme synthase CysG [Rhodomicrobium lacus]|uniref:siroheme synthase CysG n=1 Tax=Rhodomicrobium lacus TaxID=2498452 RepID=UPI000F8ED3A1|nr:siroheme synthase CysG [Rhodomicrobium lacus]
MEQLPIFFQLKGKNVAVSGGGAPAARRAELALRAGARVRVFATHLSDDFRALIDDPHFRHETRAPSPGDMAGLALAFAATGDRTQDEAMAALAGAARVPVNVADTPELCDFIMPAIVERDPLVIAISTGGASPIFARMIRARLESTIPAAYGRLVALVGSYRDRLGERLSDLSQRRRFWERALEGRVADRFLAGREDEARAELENALDAADDTALAKGEVYLVGAGPGDPDLLTFRALRLMQRADVVLYDRLLPPGILNLVRREAEHIYVGKEPDRHAVTQEEISAKLVQLAKEGKRVLRLKGGDPFMFGRGGEEIEALAAAGIPVQVVPGVTSAAGCAAYAGIPLTHRDHAQACVFVTGHARSGGGLSLGWEALVQPHQTVVIFMGLGQLEFLMKQFVAHGGDPALPAAIVENGTRPNQRVVVGTVETIAGAAASEGIRGPALVILGTVVTLRDRLVSPGGTARDDPGTFANAQVRESLLPPL